MKTALELAGAVAGIFGLIVLAFALLVYTTPKGPRD